MKKRYYICPHCEREAHHINWLTPAVLVCEHCYVKTVLHEEYEQVHRTKDAYSKVGIFACYFVLPRLYPVLIASWVDPIDARQSAFFGYLLCYLLRMSLIVALSFSIFLMVEWLLRPFEIWSLTRKFNKLYRAGELEMREE